MNKILYIISIYILFISCKKYSSDIYNVLELSGNNRGELEKVLQHYSAPHDSLKLQAACFLIKNMPGHYTLRGDKIDYCRQMIDRDTISSYYYKKLYDITLDHFIQNDKNIRREEDVEHITAEFLIRHIDASFELLNKQMLLEIIPFNFFLEYVLPYRFAYERLDLWRDSMQVISQNMPLSSLTRNFAKLRSNFDLNNSKRFHHKFINDLLQVNPFTDCYFITCNSMLTSRALGIPRIIDCIPVYSNRNGYHYWCVDPPLLYKTSTIDGALDRRTAKVYRFTFSCNPVLIPGKGEFIPEFFQNPFMQDVTDGYCYTTDIKVENQTTTRPRHAYLCVFNDLEWKPIVAGKVTQGNAEFKKLSKNIVYLPVYYDSPNVPCSFNYPFILDTKGTIKYLVPDSRNTHTLHLERKNPDLMDVLSRYYEHLDGTIVEASNNEKFSRLDTVFILNKSESLFYEARNIHLGKTYRWYRIKKARNKYIAELYFINSRGERIQGKVDSLNNAAVDGNPLTNISLNDRTLVIDFEIPVTIDKLVCLPRNDGNGIYPDNIYELFYYDFGGWQSLGMKEGDNFYLEYDNVPRNALYWLRNLTTGIEERIFTYENDQIIFW